MSPEFWYCSQAFLIAFFALAFYSRSYHIDLYPLLMIAAWLMGVCAIYLIYGDSQVEFYSNDQLIHQEIINVVIPNSQNIFNEFIGFRYLLTLPAYVFSKIGFNEMLIIKAFQLFSLLGIYTTSRNVINKCGFRLHIWHFLFIASPVFFFFSLLSLRDVILAYFTIRVVFDDHRERRLFLLVLIFLLKPHLAASLFFGWVLVGSIQRKSFRLKVFISSVFVVISYLLGSLTYSLGSFVQNGFFPGLPNQALTQMSLTRLALNFSGLQFLPLISEEKGIVASSLSQLLLTRLLFVDTFLIPVLFLLIALFACKQLSHEAKLIGSSFFFYLGIVLQTDFNSTRQNLPFLAAMGIIVVVNIEYSKAIRQKSAIDDLPTEAF
jgi:hypothetical protein